MEPDGEDQHRPYLTFKNYKLQRFTGETDAEQFVKEAKIVLQLQPMTDPVAAGWILNAIEGRPKQDLLMRDLGEINTPEKIFEILVNQWGDQRNATTLTAALLKRQQGRHESIREYASALKLLWTKAKNASHEEYFSETFLRDIFINGLSSTSLKQEMRRYIRDHPHATFANSEQEAQRWVKENQEEASVEQSSVVTLLEKRVAELAMETENLRQQLMESRVAAAQQQQTFRKNETAEAYAKQDRLPRNKNQIVCWWCHRRGHKEADCYSKRRQTRSESREQRETPRFFQKHTERSQEN